jgi:hypothetical protein
MKEWIIKYKWWLLVAILLLTAIALYFVFNKKKTLLQRKGIDEGDDKLFSDLINKLNSDKMLSSNPDNQAALLSDAARRFDGVDNTADIYKIRGVLPKSGALLATIDAWIGGMRLINNGDEKIRLDSSNAPWMKESTRNAMWQMYSSYKINKLM